MSCFSSTSDSEVRVEVRDFIERVGLWRSLEKVCYIDHESVYGVASRQYVREYQFTHHRSRYSNKLLLGYAIDRW